MCLEKRKLGKLTITVKLEQVTHLTFFHQKFEKDGSYKFSKAEGEIKKKKLSSEMESALLKAHVECQASAKATVTDKTKVVEQVQLYQVCVSIAAKKISWTFCFILDQTNCTISPFF